MKQSGLLISFEGGEGSGKSSAIVNLGRWLLAEHGIVPVVTREPGRTDLGEAIRDMLLNKDCKIIPLAETFLFEAARAQIVSEIIIPSLYQDMVVIANRFIDSGVAYQGVGRGVGVSTVKGFNDLSTKGIIPDITFLLDLDPRIGLKRKIGNRKLDNIDREDIGFHDRVRSGYLKEAKADTSERWVVLDGNQTEELLNRQIESAVEMKLHQSGFLERRNMRIERW